MRLSGRLTEVDKDALLLDVQQQLRELRAVVFAMAHEMAGNPAAPETCLRAVLNRIAPQGSVSV